MKKFQYIYILLALALFTACSKDDAPVEEASRTILVYMAANNSLGDDGCDAADIAEMKTAVAAGCLDGGGRLLVFHAAPDGSQRLFEISANGSEKTIRTYDENTYSITSRRMLEVMADAKSAAPAADYGLVLWSHALGWTQNGQVETESANVAGVVAPLEEKTWGDDRGHAMNITTLRDVLAREHWSFVYFDCCLMGSVEVAYELREVLPVMVASATKIPLDGMPYDVNLPLLYAPIPNYDRVAANTLAYYNAMADPEDRTFTVGVFHLSYMQMLADATAKIYKVATIVGPTDFTNLPLDLGYRPLYYDFGVYVRGMIEANNLDYTTYYTPWEYSYNRVVTWHGATAMLWDEINLSGFTGASTYIPRSSADLTYRNYNTLAWYDAVAKYLY